MVKAVQLLTIVMFIAEITASGNNGLDDDMAIFESIGTSTTSSPTNSDNESMLVVQQYSPAHQQTASASRGMINLLRIGTECPLCEGVFKTTVSDATDSRVKNMFFSFAGNHLSVQQAIVVPTDCDDNSSFNRAIATDWVKMVAQGIPTMLPTQIAFGATCDIYGGCFVMNLDAATQKVSFSFRTSGMSCSDSFPMPDAVSKYEVLGKIAQLWLDNIALKLQFYYNN
jgi:hypothetical protein